MSKIEKALLDATGVKEQRDDEDRQKYLVRIMMGVQKLPEDEWTALEATAGAQDWYNKATEADNAEKKLPDFPDLEEDEENDTGATEVEENEGSEEQEETEVEEEETDVDRSSKKSSKKSSKGSAAKKAPAAGKGGKLSKPAKTAAPKKGNSMRRTLKLMVVRSPKRTTEELMEALEKKGFKSPSKLTVVTIRADTRDTMKVLREAGVDVNKISGL